MDMGVTKNLAEKMTEIMRLKKKKNQCPQVMKQTL